MRNLANHGARDLANPKINGGNLPFSRGDGGPGGTTASVTNQHLALANYSKNAGKAPSCPAEFGEPFRHGFTAVLPRDGRSLGAIPSRTLTFPLFHTDSFPPSKISFVGIIGAFSRLANRVVAL